MVLGPMPLGRVGGLRDCRVARTAHQRVPHNPRNTSSASVKPRKGDKDTTAPAQGEDSTDGRVSKETAKAPASGDGDGSKHRTAATPAAYAKAAADVLQSAVPAGAWRPDARIVFAIPPADLTTPLTEVLRCPTMRGLLGEPRPTPLGEALSGIWEGRYVSDADRVALNVMDFASPASAGAHAMCVGPPAAVKPGTARIPATPPSPSTPSQAAAAAAAAGHGSSSSRHLAMESGVYGSSVSTLSVDSFAGEGLLQGQQVCMPLPPFALRAGPRDEIYYDPATVTAAIVTTGNICPGMNDVIQAMVKRLGDYGVPEENVLGIRYGMRGFSAKDAKPVVLTREQIEGIHLHGGTILGTSNDHKMHRTDRHHRTHPTTSGDTTSGSSDEEEPPSPAASSPSSSSVASRPSRGAGGRPSPIPQQQQQSPAQQLEAILDKLEFWRINMLFVIGGQGGNQLGAQLAEGCQRRAIPCCIVGVPKSIDNDVMLVDKTFGFDTVVQEVVQRPLLAAKVESASARKGVGLVKVFGRRSGFIALQASLASGVVDVCLIPEEPFELAGPAGVLEYIKALIEAQGHVVMCVAEGAGQDLLYPGGEDIPLDESGNPLLRDIGTALKKAIKGAIPDADVKYIDPTYMVQAVPCHSQDHIYCRVLGFHAVDAAFAGYTGCMVGQVNGHFVLLPSSVVTQSARRVDPQGKSWNRLRAAIGQPRFKNSSPSGTHVVPTTAAAAADAKAKQHK